MVDAGIVVQPRLQMSVATAAQIASGHAHQVGGVVREVGSGRLVELLSDAPGVDDVADEVVKQLGRLRLQKFDISKITVPKLDSMTAVKVSGALLVAGMAVGGFIWIAGRRREGETLAPAEQVIEELGVATVDEPRCLVDFRGSLEAYVRAGANGALTSELIDALVADLDAVQAYSERGSVVVFTLDELGPFIELVIAHTAELATALDVTYAEPDADSADVVVSMRDHLQAQARILSEAA